MKSLIIILFLIISANSFAQLQDLTTRLMTSTEIEDMVKLALSDINVLAKNKNSKMRTISMSHPIQLGR